MRVTLVIGTLSGGGGAERVVCLMANYWAERGRRVTLIKMDAASAIPHYAVRPDVVLESADIPSVRARSSPKMATVNCLRRLRNVILAGRPHIVIAFMPEPNALARLATLGSRVPVVLMEQNDPCVEPVPRRTALLRRLAYPLAARVVLLHEGSMAFFGAGVRRKSTVIPNPITFDAEHVSAARVAAGPKLGTRVIGMGRLVEQKGFDILIRAFARVANAHPGWSLDIWGEGELRGELERLIAQCGMTGRITLPGRTQCPLEAICRSDLFVLSSRYEGMPMVLGEAMAAGTTVIAFDCPTGPANMIRHGVDGLLVAPGDEDGLVAAVDRLMGNPAERARLASRAPEVLERYALPRVMAMWETLVSELV
jgi:glycosyltransferase involved in cell wall biosynthesis